VVLALKTGRKISEVSLRSGLKRKRGAFRYSPKSKFRASLPVNQLKFFEHFTTTVPLETSRDRPQIPLAPIWRQHRLSPPLHKTGRLD
jgi:hypothetical protein